MNLKNIQTEQRNQNTLTIDQMTTNEILRVMNEEDHVIPEAVKAALPVIEQLVDQIVDAFQQNGRLIYVGAGTSGRLGVLDASECPPTFGTPSEQVIGVIAGGDQALQYALEGAEDDEAQAVEDMKNLHLTPNDVIVGIAASGRTPYTVAAMTYAKTVGATVGAVTCSDNTKMEEVAHYSVVASVGPEVVTGSTRMKAGTAQKLVLNMLTTASMIKIGKVYSNLMVDVVPTNRKLVQRGKNIVAEIAGVSIEEAEKSLETYGSTKAAILSLLTGLTGESVHATLERYDGHLRKAIESAVVPS
ncbi:N-acetylmuramic acid 6-phosphate etherase [Pseudalkalibacillus hwajinpoensis]|uniref:N-acetylmuramic acid 6-phosphate etherase n=1 Tax=Guptibacillus hwajinpoensis TaxID=208199 RepID=UPI001CFF3B51|nr:N-acetylmuramic acid 6-phosphate etherase [Pseudalkalibacillus hwajinpoensis]